VDGDRADNGAADGDRADNGAADGGRVDAAAILAAAAGRSLVAVVRDAHRDEQTRSLVAALLAARPDLILVEMGLPFWRPPEGTSYLATYGASRASAHAAAELLGLASAKTRVPRLVFHSREGSLVLPRQKPFVIMAGALFRSGFR
jgi:hypothetical protein